MPQLPYTFIVTPMAETKFQEVESAVRQSEGSEFKNTSATHGSVHTKDVDFDYDYDPNNVRLTITVTSANDFLAKHVSDSVIESHIRDLISKA
jgi:hypothetical protein